MSRSPLIILLFASLVSVAAAGREPTPPPYYGPHFPLRVGLYVAPETRQYNPSVYLFHFQIGERIASAAEREFRAAFQSAEVLSAYPIAESDWSRFDCVITVSDPKLERTGFAHPTLFLSATFTAYSRGNPTPIARTTKPAQASPSSGSADTYREDFSRLATQLSDEFIKELSQTPLVLHIIAPPPPKPAAPPPQQPAVLEITSSAAVQVYVDDEFKGSTSSEGRLVITLPAGTHKLRLSEAGKKEWAQPVQLLAGERHPVTAKLEAAGPKPLSESDIEDALSNGLSKGRVLALIKQYGVNFELAEAVESRLRKAGADDEVLLAVVKNKK